MSTHANAEQTSSGSAPAATSSSSSDKPDAGPRYDIDPADPRRRVAHKKANSPFLVHQRWKAEQQRLAERRTADEAAKQNDGKMSPKIVELPADAADPVATTAASTGTSASTVKGKGKGKGKDANRGSTAAASPSLAYLTFKWSLVAVLMAFGAGQFIAGDLLWGYRGKYVKKQTYFPPKPRIFTPDELWQHNGKDPDRPIYLSILGNVYDVTPGRWIYGPKGSYHFFAGRDASRSFVTGCFETHLTHDLRGLSADEIESIGEWKRFFDNHARYQWIGKADLEPIDPSSPIPAPCNVKPAESKDPSQI